MNRGTYPDKIWGNPRCHLLLHGQLLVCRVRRVNNQCLCIPGVREVARQPLFSHVGQLDLSENTFSPEGEWTNDVEPTLFELFKHFTVLQSLYVSGGLLPLVAPALRRLAGERAAEVFPHLYSIFFTGPPQSESIRKDIDAVIAALQCFNQCLLE